ncbi:mitochondrial protein C2orf69 homolog isoform X2 [Aethina tumida]|uniref:mitochondrial protein C2orf69 homolog isoform X2 n=1 Tax=Aethina tumida TaxID=116153 RepID=UPI002147DFAF|nr:mitochondrial protein C2orf69 homolog isoform X2 [Aethina tumida]XP_049821621.1 mitochondrial protein C2orf69 homolog isoform X2 [Aethina tumida]XP_049821622.1 mitochondrial protein C2orf69 homolog isoform X2 [Aethina tumida]
MQTNKDSAVPPRPVRLCRVNGYNDRHNDVVYCHPAVKSPSHTVVVFFGGDVQDFTENMQVHRDNKNYIQWNLEDTAKTLQTGFPENHIVVIRPSRMEYKTFSCFENFVPSSKCGAPEHTPMHNALEHLEKLLVNISESLRTMKDCDIYDATPVVKPDLVQIDILSDSSSDNATFNKITDKQSDDKEPVKVVEAKWDRDNIYLENYDIILVGFSKGCVVLNQFLYEFHYFKTLTPEDSNLLRIISKIKEIYWLDGGHSGGKNTWITSRPLLETLTGLGVKIHVHVTPYQIEDERRPWIKKEEKTFHDILKRQGASIDRHVHFPNVVPNINIHFEVISLFRQ